MPLQVRHRETLPRMARHGNFVYKAQEYAPTPPSLCERHDDRPSAARPRGQGYVKSNNGIRRPDQPDAKANRRTP